MIDCSKYSDEELVEYREVHHNAFNILHDTILRWSPSYYNEGDRQRHDYVIFRNRILYNRKQIGEIVEYVSKTRCINYRSVPLLDRFVLYSENRDFTIEEYDMSSSSIIEFSIDNDNMSNEKTIVKLTRLKECVMQVCQLQVLDTM